MRSALRARWGTLCEDEPMETAPPTSLRDEVAARLEQDFAELWGVLQAAAAVSLRNQRHGQAAKAMAAYLAARGRLAISAFEDLASGRRPVLFGINDEGLRAMAPYATIELPLDAVLRWLKAVHERLVEHVRSSDPAWWADDSGRGELTTALGVGRDGVTPYAAAAAALRQQLSATSP